MIIEIKIINKASFLDFQFGFFVFVAETKFLDLSSISLCCAANECTD